MKKTVLNRKKKKNKKPSSTVGSKLCRGYSYRKKKLTLRILKRWLRRIFIHSFITHSFTQSATNTSSVQTSLKQCFLRCGPRNSSITQEFVRNASSQIIHQSTESQFPDVGARRLWGNFLSFCNFYHFFWWCHSAYGILVPQPGIEPAPPALKVQSLDNWTAREVSVCGLTCPLLGSYVS